MQIVRYRVYTTNLCSSQIHYKMHSIPDFRSGIQDELESNCKVSLYLITYNYEAVQLHEKVIYCFF